MPNFREQGNWRVAKESTPGVAPAFGDAAWKLFKVQSGAGIMKKPTLTDIDPIRNDLSAFDVEVTREDTSGSLPTWMEAPASAGAVNEIDTHLEALFGSKVSTIAMAGLIVGSTLAKVEVDEVAPTLTVGMMIKIPTNVGDHIAVVKAITLNTAPAKDVLDIFPSRPTGSTIPGGSSITAAVHYVPKSGPVNGELQTLAFQRLYVPPDANELWTWPSCKVNTMTIPISPGNVINPTFEVMGIDEIKADPAPGTFSAPAKGGSFVCKKIITSLDTVALQWLSNINVSFSNSLTAQEGVEAPTGVSGHAEGVRNVTVAMNYKYLSSADRAKFQTATKRELFFYASRLVGAETRYMACYAPQLVATDYNEPIDNRIKKIDSTFRAYSKVKDDEFILSLL